MSGKLSEVQGRIGTVHQLEAVITAMRGSAAARSREARSRLDGIRAYATVVAGAIGQALALDPEAEPRAHSSDKSQGHAVIALCAEQGFAGTFNERVLDEAVRHTKSASAELLVVGYRGRITAAERGIAVAWSAPMVAHADEVPALASRIADTLYDRLEQGRTSRATMIHAVPGPSASIGVVERPLLPFDFSRFKVAPRAIPPLTTLRADLLLLELGEEYVYAELCEAVMLSFAAENEARMRAMIAARSHVQQKLDELVGSFRRLRQEEITGEIIELSAGSTSASGPVRRKRNHAALLANGGDE